MKPLALAADGEDYKYKYIVWVFNGRFAISSAKPRQNCRFPLNPSNQHGPDIIIAFSFAQKKS